MCCSFETRRALLTHQHLDTRTYPRQNGAQLLYCPLLRTSWQVGPASGVPPLPHNQQSINNLSHDDNNLQQVSLVLVAILAGNLAFPLLLVAGLFLLSRRTQGGMGPGGPGNPMSFGKSRAKFQMEPNTGVTFEDVAGVEEAKQDFMEVGRRPCQAHPLCLGVQLPMH